MLALFAALCTAAVAAEPDLGWLVGTWRGQEGAVTWEESWAPALGGAMLGSFRLVEDGEVRFYELMTLHPAEPGGAALRIKHFGPDLKGWEAQDAHVGFRLRESSGQKLVFEGTSEPTRLVYERQGDSLLVELRKQPAGEAASVSTFRMGRAAP